ncbi:MAG: hypothetical protein GW775_00170 [Candidatus Magasanikbacteria bacterium]|nr:hypothetical protein [Candidatus Magasanikbacteria bacterium]
MGSLHPAIIHIPIGLLILYSGIELFLFLFPRYTAKLALGKYIMILFGVLGGFLSLSSGEGLEHLKKFNHNLVEIHSFFATATVWLYGIILFALSMPYLHAWKPYTLFIQKSSFLKKIHALLMALSTLLTNRLMLVFLAIVGAILLTFTGTLGGAIAHGPETDVITSAVYSLFF